MAKTNRRESIDTLGLMVVKHAVQDDPKAECVGHFPTHVVTSLHEIEPDETVGELLARLGLDEGDSITIRFPTVIEDRVKLAIIIADLNSIRPDAEPAALSDASLDAEIGLLEATAATANEPAEDLTEAGHARLFALQDERSRRTSIAAEAVR